MPDKQQTFGQFETPPDVADLLLAFCLRQAQDRVLDPSCGTGAFLRRAALWQQWLAGSDDIDGSTLWGVELDDQAVGAARAALPGATILHQNFFTLEPEEPFDAIVGNPPYTRAEWFDRLQEEAGRQLAIFAKPETAAASEQGAGGRRQELLPAHSWKDLSRRAGLHTYFFLHGTAFLREGGRFGFVVPNNWLDVAYGKGLKQFLLEHYRIVALIEPGHERWFQRASVNTSLVVLERCTDAQARQENLIRFIQLGQPLARLIPYPPEHRDRRGAVETLAARLLPHQERTTAEVRIRTVWQREIKADDKWGLYWRAPAVYRRVRRQATEKKLVPLKTWATIRRGFTTGANHFFYLDEKSVEEWAIEPEYRHPLLKSLRQVDQLRLTTAACTQEAFITPPASLPAGTGARAYVAWGETTGLNDRPTCAGRQPWYALPVQEPAPLLLPKGVWGRFMAPLLEEPILVDQQLYQVQLAPGVSRLAAAALLNSSWLALQLELQGRVNFGEGVLWLAGYEIENLVLPDPRYLQAGQLGELEALFSALAEKAVPARLEEALLRPEQQALDRTVSELVGLSPAEAIAVAEALLQNVQRRQRRARSPR